MAKLSAWFAASGGSIAAAATPVLVVVTAIAPAVMAQLKNEEGWKSEYEHAEEVANAAEERGANPDDVDLLRRLNAASGIKVDENGNYKKNFFGFLDMNPTSQADWVLQSLGDPRKRGQIYSDIMTYGDPENDNVAGWKPWNALLRYWGEYRDETGRKVDMPLEAHEEDALIEYLRDLQIRKLESGMGTEDTLNDAVNEMKMNTSGSKQAVDKVANMDLKKFNGLPSEMQAAVMRGAAQGVGNMRVEIDGASAGRVLAPYVNTYMGQAAM